MALKNYLLAFGTGNPSSNTGLSPTLSTFKVLPSGTNVTAPGVTEIPTSTGLYYFQYDPIGSTSPISFICDGGSSLSTSNRYVVGICDPADAIDQYGMTLVAIGTTNSSYVIGLSSISSLIGTTASSFGSTAADPTTLFGYLKRAQEFNEGNSTFDKTASVWYISTRGSSTMLAAKTLADGSGNVTKS